MLFITEFFLVTTKNCVFLLSDENVIYSDVPFDYQIDSDCGSYYMDPECPSDTITWLYAVIPHTYPLPEVGTAEVQVLDILHTSRRKLNLYNMAKLMV